MVVIPGHVTLVSETNNGAGAISYTHQLYDMTGLIHQNMTQDMTIVTDFKYNLQFILARNGSCSYRQIK